MVETLGGGWVLEGHAGDPESPVSISGAPAPGGWPGLSGTAASYREASGGAPGSAGTLAHGLQGGCPLQGTALCHLPPFPELPPAHRAESLSRAGLTAKQDTGDLALLLAAVGLVFLCAGSSRTGGPHVQENRLLVLGSPPLPRRQVPLGPEGRRAGRDPARAENPRGSVGPGSGWSSRGQGHSSL